MSASCILIACASANAASTRCTKRWESTYISMVRRPSSASRRSSRSTAEASTPKSSPPSAGSSSRSDSEELDARSSAASRSPDIALLFCSTESHTDLPGLNPLLASAMPVPPMSSARHPQYNASITSVDVTSFSLKKRFTIPLSNTSAFSVASAACCCPPDDSRNCRMPSHFTLSSRILAKPSRFSSMNRRQMPSTLVRYTRTSSRRYWLSRHRKGRAGFSWITCTCALITKVSATVNPSSTLDSSINFFHPQSCSFLQNRCRVSEYLDFLGSLFTTAMVNCAK
mmetsp:Transcript_23473/g.58159  ORF Transcript_23473/g.58159 Transcript_23473/m.58159 type:complete len:284 (+) Transcript_23473:1497-2348(+)